MAMPRSIKTFKQVLVAAAVLAATGASAAGGDAGETVKPVATHDLPNLPGKRLTAIVVTYARAPSRHDTTTLAASGPMCCQGPSAHRIPRPVRPRCTGRGTASSSRPAASIVSENASATQSASLLAVHIADDGAGLTTIDK